MLHALVYRHFREELKPTGLPGGVQEDLPCPCPPLRLLVFCFSAKKTNSLEELEGVD